MRFFKKLGIIGLGLSMALGVGISLGVSNSNVVETKAVNETISVVPDQSTTGSTATSYVTITTTFAYSGVSYKINQWNPNTLQIKVNETKNTNAFSFCNSTAIPGAIKSVTIKGINGGGYLNSANIQLITGSSSCENVTSGGQTNGTFTSPDFKWIVSNNAAFFRILSVNGSKAGFGTVRIASIDIEYEPITSATLDHIAITSAPTKTSYYVGEFFDSTGMTVTAYYDDSTSAILSSTAYTYSPNGALANTDNKVTVSYTERGVTKTVDQSISVQDRILQSIYIESNPTKTTYEVGNQLDFAGLVVKGRYNVGDEMIVTSECNYSPDSGYTFVNSDVGTKTITISHTGVEDVTFSVTVNAFVPIGNIESGAKYIITASNDSTHYVLKTGEFAVGQSGTATETYTDIEALGSEYAWTFTSTGVNNTYTITYESNGTTIGLHHTATNNGVVSSDSDIGNFVVSESATTGEIYLNSLSRYLSAYTTTPNWRCYTTTGNGLPSIKLYKYEEPTASSLASYIMAEDTEGQCVTKFPVAKARYLSMSSSEQALFVATSEDATIRNAVARYEAWAVNQGELPYAEGSSSVSHFGEITNSSAIITVVVISVIGLTSVAGFFFLNKKRKETN